MTPMPDAQTLFLVYADVAASSEGPVHLPGDAFMLADTLFLVRSDLTRSELYHQVKLGLPTDAALLVAPLADAPKFRRLHRGALKWLRESND
ncbi:hypothetical protein [Sphingopyxis sp. JAI128]|uniref:hypothetical protein n=1 Tax=Sphingopyxis sp. JAI128 TaxID=2723066 RepID=UPI00161F4CB8|nr:hypothetical protein [Sphingopyxis sp. JAI128]MBB6425718.1 hypothetical protein [Sphingopyxis sp. JAI128]